MNEKLSIEAMVLGALAARTNGILELNFSETLNVKGVIIAIEKDKIIIKGTYHDQQLFRLLQGFDSTKMKIWMDQKGASILKEIDEENNGK